ncbi:MAG: GntR family transcriptional regulator [Steroidobacteraceae bacterium]
MAETNSTLQLAALSPGGAGPLYEQIVEAIRREVASGHLPAGSPMPSFRALAAQLAVSLITVKRAYEELERDGIILRHQGLGTFIAPGGDHRSRSERRSVAVEALRTAVRAGREAGLEDRELLKMLQRELAHPRLPTRREPGARR